MTSRRQFISLLGGAVAAWPMVARAQQTEALIGFLSTASANDFAGQLRAFRLSLSEGDFVEGKNLKVEYRRADGNYSRLPALAVDLGRQGVAVIATAGGVPSALAARQATTNTPVVFVTGADPVKAGLINSLSRPGGNVTGITALNVEVGSKRLELLRELLPAATKVAFLVNPTSPITEAVLRELRAAATTLRFEYHVLEASADSELDAVFRTVQRLRASGLVIGTDAFFISRIQKLAKLALHHTVPTIFQFREFAAAGGLISYGGDFTETYRLSGAYVARILKGEKPADLPVQQATKLELIVNLKTAKAISIEIPTSVLLRADEVIE